MAELDISNGRVNYPNVYCTLTYETNPLTLCVFGLVSSVRVQDALG